MTSDPLDPRSISIADAWSSSRVVRPILGFIGVSAAATTLGLLKWDDASGTTGILSMRIFVVVYTLSAVVFILGLVPADLWSRRSAARTWSALPAWVHYLAAGILIGVAIGITDWLGQPLHAAHLWWTFFMAVGLLSPQVDNRRITKKQGRRLTTRSAARVQ